MQKSIYNYIIFNIAYLFLGMVIVEFYPNFYKYFSWGEVVLFTISLIFILRGAYKRHTIMTIDIILVSLIIAEIIALFFSLNIKWSLFGSIFRHEGFFQILYYYSLFYLSTYIKDDNFKEKIIYMILTVGIINCLFSWEQVNLRIPFSIPTQVNYIFYADGFTTHSNFLGTLLTICYALSIGMAVLINNKKYFILSFLFFFGILLSNCTSSLITVLILTFFLFLKGIVEKKRKQIRKLVLFIVACMFLIFVLDKYNYTDLISEFSQTLNEANQISSGNIDNTYGTGRFYIWQEIIIRLPKYIWTGTGIDCLLLIDNYPILDAFREHYVDKAHNEFLNILITEGVVVFVIYLAFLYGVICNYIKNRDNQVNKILFFAFVSYIFQAMFNIRVIEVAPYFFIIAGLLFHRPIKEEVILKNV